MIHGEPDGPQINSAFSSSISWRSMSVHDDDSSLATPAPATADLISEPPPRSSSPTTHRPPSARRQRRSDNAIRRQPDFLSKAKSRFNIFLNILQSPSIAMMFLQTILSMFALSKRFFEPSNSRVYARTPPEMALSLAPPYTCYGLRALRYGWSAAAPWSRLFLLHVHGLRARRYELWASKG